MQHNGHSIGKYNHVVLMVWDTDPKTYNKPGIETKVASKVELNPGDTILLAIKEQTKKILNIDEVISVKDGYMSDYRYYYVLKTTRKIV